MTPQHLSDEAVAAFADGVLNGHARDRAARHTNGCAECREAVKIQREAAFALRTAGAPSLPSTLLDRLRTVPMTTPLDTPPTAVAPDGSTVLSTLAPMAAFVPAESARTHRTRPYLATAAVVALAGALTAGSVSNVRSPSGAGTGHVVRQAPQVRTPARPVPAVVELYRNGRP
jgi:hypothetical protein